MVPNGICASHSYSAPPVATNGDNRPTMEPDAFHASRSSLGFGREDARHNDSRGLGLIVVSPSSKTEDKYLWRLAFDRILLDAEALIIIRRGQPRFCSQRLLLVYRHHRVCCFGFCLLYDRRRQAARSVSRRRGRQARAWSKFPRREASRVSSRGGDPSRGRDMNGIVMHARHGELPCRSPPRSAWSSKKGCAWWFMLGKRAVPSFSLIVCPLFSRVPSWQPLGPVG